MRLKPLKGILPATVVERAQVDGPGIALYPLEELVCVQLIFGIVKLSNPD